MKKTILIWSLIGFFGFLYAQRTPYNREFSMNEAIEKVNKMQSIIKFNDEKAKKLIEIEYRYLLQLEKIKKCKSSNTVMEAEKLKHKKDKAIMKLLPRDEYLKYNAIENKLIKKQPIRV